MKTFKQICDEVIGAFAHIIHDMDTHDRACLLVGLASQEYLAGALPSNALPSLNDCACPLITEENDRTTPNVESVLAQFDNATQAERLALVTVIVQTIGGGL